MTLRINDIAPDFDADTSAGPIRFHDWIGDGWTVLFSHPKNFTPVCTTELGAMAGLENAFRERGVKIGTLLVTEPPVRLDHSAESIVRPGKVRDS